ncbi:lipopolysaccharide biosynthesis protein [Pedobacter sp. B4-66]|uniref:exopolysaccharide transport family protein n=1 Tax=Pedobacter sp. B4-66 TaxID=2817280 RepID=UPI001BDB2132|nr:lipopolysaccharide biosynthesis protein [Pedobacter sp. B4-66]
MDIRQFFKLLKHYKWILIVVPVVSVIVTGFFVKDLPKKYVSKSQISTGLIDQSQQISSNQNNNQDYFRVNSQFANIMEIMKMDKTTSVLSYNLIIHDLEDPYKAFTKYSDEIKNLSPTEKSALLEEYKKLLSSKTVITPALNGKLKVFDILESMKYDAGSLNKKLTIYHIDNSDFITILFTSENPNFSAFVVNSLSSDFISTYSIDVANNQNKSNVLLDSLLKQKEDLMNEKNAALKNYKVNNGVLNLDKQSEIIYKQITDYEQKKSDAIRLIQSNQGAISNIDQRINGNDQTYAGGSVIADNNKIVNIKNQLKIANERYVDNNFNPADKKKVDSLQVLLSEQMNNASNRYVADPTANKQSLITQKMGLEVALDQARSSIKSIDSELNQLRAKYNTMVPFDAGVQNFERDADVATKEYLEVLNRSNTNSLEKKIGLKLNLAEAGYPGVPEPSKKVLYVALSAVASLVICLMGILVVFLLDKSVNTVRQLQKVTNNKVIGRINLIKKGSIEVRDLWKEEHPDSEHLIYKDLLRSLRFEVDQLLSEGGNKILGITSLLSGEGKTFLTSSLVYAFAMTGKKVLLIRGDQEPEHASSDQKLIPDQFFETFIIKKEIQIEDLITVLNTKSDSTSLFEIQNKDNLKSGFSILKEEFDLIIVDIASLENINRAKEWLLFTEKNIAVFAAGQTISDEQLENLEYITKHPGFMGWVLNKQVES